MNTIYAMNVFRDPPPFLEHIMWMLLQRDYVQLYTTKGEYIGHSKPNWNQTAVEANLSERFAFAFLSVWTFVFFCHITVTLSTHTCAVCHTPCETRVPFQVWQHCHWTATWKWCGTRGVRYNWAINLNDCVTASHPKSGIVTQARCEGVRTGRRVNHFHVDWRWCKGSTVTDLSGTEIW